MTVYPATPTTLSDLLTMALDDVEQIEQQPGYVLDMYHWHAVIDDQCHVCMAGAIMACRLGVPFKTLVTLDPTVDVWWAPALRAANALRTGEVGYAFYLFEHREPTVEERDVMTRVEKMIEREYDSSVGHAPWAVYRQAAAVLQEAGL